MENLKNQEKEQVKKETEKVDELLSKEDVENLSGGIDSTGEEATPLSWMGFSACCNDSHLNAGKENSAIR